MWLGSRVFALDLQSPRFSALNPFQSSRLLKICSKKLLTIISVIEGLGSLTEKTGGMQLMLKPHHVRWVLGQPGCNVSAVFSATEQMLDRACCLMVPICLPSRGEEIEDKEVIIQELEVGKKSDNFWRNYLLLKPRMDPHPDFCYFPQTESQTLPGKLVSPCKEDRICSQVSLKYECLWGWFLFVSTRVPRQGSSVVAVGTEDLLEDCCCLPGLWECHDLNHRLVFDVQETGQ